MVSDVKLALPFYKEVLGFVTVSPPDNSLANIVRTSSGKPFISGVEEGVQLHLRTAYVPPPSNLELAARGALHNDPTPTATIVPMSVYIQVESVEDMFDEIYTRAKIKTDPSEEDYFPSFPFGKARIAGRPMNTPFGTREIRVYDPDANLLVFFEDVKTAAPTATNGMAAAPNSSAGKNLVRGPVQRPRRR